MFGTIYVLTNPLLSFLCINSIKVLRFEPFTPMADNKAFKRLAFAISRFEVEGVEGVLTCGVEGLRGELVWLYGCMVERDPYECRYDCLHVELTKISLSIYISFPVVL